MMCEGFIEKITVLDEWETSSDQYRLVNKGAGPDELQIMDDGAWRPESRCYVHSTLTSRIKKLSEKTTELQDFAIWMTGCGYDFCELPYFCEQRDKLLK